MRITTYTNQESLDLRWSIPMDWVIDELTVADGFINLDLRLPRSEAETLRDLLAAHLGP